MKKLQIGGRNGAILHEGIEVDDFFPETGTVENDRDFFGELPGLHESQNLEEFVQGSKSSGEDDEGLRQISEPELAHEEVVELEIEFIGDIRVGELFERKTDVEPDSLAFRIRGAAI